MIRLIVATIALGLVTAGPAEAARFRIRLWSSKPSVATVPPVAKPVSAPAAVPVPATSAKAGSTLVVVPVFRGSQAETAKPGDKAAPAPLPAMQRSEPQATTAAAQVAPPKPAGPLAPQMGNMDAAPAVKLPGFAALN